MRFTETQDPRLTAGHKERLDRDGWTIFPSVLSPRLTARLAGRCDELAAAEGDRAGVEQYQEPGCVRVADLVNKDPVFDVCWTHPLLLAAVAHVLNRRPFKLSSLSSRDPFRGEGMQPLHADWAPVVLPADAQSCNSIWMLDPFSVESGATRVVSGSHAWLRYPYEDLGDPFAPHPREGFITGLAGSLVVFSSHLWHGGTTNQSGARRRGIFAYFTLAENRPMTDQARMLRAETNARLDDARRRLLGVSCAQ